MKWLTLGLVLILTSLTILAPAQKGGDKNSLSLQRQKLLKDLAESKRILESVKKNKSNSLIVLNAIQSKLDARKALISNYQKSVVEIDHSILLTSAEINTLEKNIEKLKKDYAQMIKYAYLHRTSLNIISFIFSADSYQEAFKRIGYLRKYRQVRNKQLAAILNSQEQLQNKINYYAKQKSNKTTLLNAEVHERNTIEAERAEKAKAYENFKGQEKDIRAKIAKQQADAKKLQNQIQYLIKKEMQAKAEKLARERAEAAKKAKQLEAERKKKLEAARIAREKAEAEKRKLEQERLEQERLARIEREKEEERVRKEQERLKKLEEEERKRKEEALAEAKKRQEQEQAEAKKRQEQRRAEAQRREEERLAEAKRKAQERLAEAKRKAQEAFDKRQKELAEIKRREEQEKAKIAQAKRVETKQSQPAQASTSAGLNFGQAAGKLNRPVSGRVVGHFGTQSHPVFSNIQIENNGVDIYASRGAPVHAVYEGTVSSILPTPGGNGSTMLINHGEYFTVYTNLASIKVGTGTKVNRGQIIGTVGSNSDGEPVINFQIWRSSGSQSYKLNPENWIRF